jgi:hypothetical protein
MKKGIEHVKKALRPAADPIALDDLVSAQIDLLTERTSRDVLRHDDRQVDAAAVIARIAAYEDAVTELAGTVALIARWGTREHMPTLQRVFTQVGDANDSGSGIQQWVSLSWLPFFILEYSAGVAAISAARYDVLGVIHGALAGKRDYSEDPTTAVARAVARMCQAGRDAVFSLHPEYNRRGPRVSNYLAVAVRRQMENVISFRAEFDVTFDRFEVLDTMLIYSRHTPENRVYAPPGRFAWKAMNRVSAGDSLTHMEAEARELGDAWGPTKAGLFSGSAARFLELTAAYRKEYFSHVTW